MIVIYVSLKSSKSLGPWVPKNGSETPLGNRASEPHPQKCGEMGEHFSSGCCWWFNLLLQRIYQITTPLMKMFAGRNDEICGVEREIETSLMMILFRWCSKAIVPGYQDWPLAYPCSVINYKGGGGEGGGGRGRVGGGGRHQWERDRGTEGHRYLAFISVYRSDCKHGYVCAYRQRGISLKYCPVQTGINWVDGSGDRRDKMRVPTYHRTGM